MSMDIAELGLSVRSDGVVIADRRLDKLAQSARKTETATQRLVRQTERMNATMKSMGRSMALYATLPIIGVLGGAVKAFANFDEAMVASMAIMGELSDSMKNDLADAAKEVALTTAFSAKQAADSYYYLASAGLDAAASMAALPRVAKFAQAGNFDMAKATDILTDAQSALGMVMKDPIANMEKMTHLSNVLVKAGTLANASVQQFGEALTNKAGTAMKLLNIDVETGIAVLAAWADQGIKATEAGEKFNIVTRDLQTAVRKNAAEFRKYNVEVFDNGKFRNMADIIGDLERALAPMTAEQQGATLALMGFQDRSVMAIKSLLGLSEKIAGYESKVRSMGNVTDEVADKQMQTFNKQAGLMKDRIVGVAIELGENLLPLMSELKDDLEDFISWITDAVDTFTSYDVETQKMILGAIAFTAAIGPLLIILGMLAGAISNLIPIAIGFFAIFAAPMPFAAIALGIGLVVDAVGDLYLAHLEKAIGVTDDYTASLNRLAHASKQEFGKALADLDVDVLQEKLKGVTDTIAQLTEEQRIFEEEITRVQSRLDAGHGAGSPALLQDLQDRLIAAKTGASELGFEIASLTRLQEGLNTQIGTAAMLMWDEAEAYGAVVPVIQKVKEELKLTDDELETLLDWWGKLRAEMDPVAEAYREFDAAQANLNVLLELGEIGVIEYYMALDKLKKNLSNATGEGNKFQKVFDRLSKIKLDSLEGVFVQEDLQKEIKALKDGSEAWRDYQKTQFVATQVAKMAVDATDAQIEKVKELAGELYDLNNPVMTLGQQFEQAANSAGTMLRAIQSSMTDGSAAYEAMNIAIQASNVVQAIAAILNQAQGDPYTAPARMAAMAALVASLGAFAGSISGFGSGFADTAAKRQEEQGTGTVLGDAEAKSESIMNAVEITADATSELVGINRGMLNALRSMQQGIGNATGSIARGSGATEFNFKAPEAGFVKLFGPLLGKLLGGSSKVTDEGIAILSGTLGELIDGTLIASYQEIKYKKWKFGSKHTKEELGELGGDAAAQIGLVFQALGDAVTEGALALGISMADIQSRLDTFRVESMRISLKDLSAEEQQAEIEAVFSQIFDNLAEHVIPFIGQFQLVGEGLGETLVRVATSVQVTQEAIKMMGLSLDETDPEKFAQIAVGLMEMSGGIDEFIGRMQNFIGKFATQEWQNAIAIDAVTRGFSQLGITLPATREGLWDLVQGLDLTTESGRQQLAIILELTDSLDEYYDIQEEGIEEQKRLAEEASAAREEALTEELNALLHIQGIAEGVADSMKSLREMIIGDISTDEENYARFKAQADTLAANLVDMTDPDQIAETVAEIERLTRAAYGLLDEEQKNVMAQDFLDFLQGVEDIALARLGEAADVLIADSEFTPEEILSRFNAEVTDPLILVAGAQGAAAIKLESAADRLLRVTGADFSIQQGDTGTGPVAGTDTTAESIKTAVEKGMQAGAQAMVETASALATAVVQAAGIDADTGRTVASAIKSIPSRIEVVIDQSEFN